MLFLLRRTVDDIVLRFQRRQHWRNLADRMLQIVVHREDNAMLGRADAAQERVVLPVIPAHSDASHPAVRMCEVFNDLPGTVAAPVFGEDHLKSDVIFGIAAGSCL